MAKQRERASSSSRRNLHPKMATALPSLAVVKAVSHSSYSDPSSGSVKRCTSSYLVPLHLSCGGAVRGQSGACERALALVRWRARSHDPALAANEVREVCGGWEGKGRARASAT